MDAAVRREEATATQGRRALYGLLGFICFVTLFEGYDLLIINLALPYLGRDFGADGQTLARAVGLINVGTVLAFVPLRLADRYGRRRVFLYAILGYTVFTMLSACSVGLYDFVAWQCLARMFMVTEIGVGAIILTEEMPARWRGAAVTLMFSLSLSGGIVGAAIFPWLVDTALGWRTLYLMGGAVLPVLLWYWPRLRETRRFAATASAPARQALRALLTGPYRRRVLAGATLWFTVNAWSSSCLFFFSYYVTRERGWDAAAVSHALTLGYALAVVGYATAGPMLDLAGRRVTAFLYFSLGAASAWTCFTATEPWLITAAYAAVLAMQALWPIAATITSEIFPTAIRGTANGLVNNLIGRTGMVLAPMIVGGLSTQLGSVGAAVAMMSLLPLAALPVILWLVGETSGQELERIAS